MAAQNGGSDLAQFQFARIHHRHPAIPWRGLPLLFRERSELYHGNYFAAAARQLSGPVALEDLPRAG
jgi:fatty acid desaturase